MGVKRIEVVMVCSLLRTGFAQRNPYATDVNRERNCYACGEFGYIAWHYINRRTRNKIVEERKLEYGNNRQRRIEKRNKESNLNGEWDLILLN